MPYGNLNADVVQSSTANTPVQFNDGNGTQVGTLCRAWVCFNGTTGARNASFNVSSVTRNGTGDYTVNFATAMTDVNYVTVTSAAYTSTAAAPTRTATMYTPSKATSSCRVIYGYTFSGGYSTEDAPEGYISIFR